MKIIMVLTGKHIVFIVENCSVPFDPRVWREAKTLKKIGARISIISPLGYKRDNKKYEVIDDIEIYRYQLPINNYSKIGYIFEYIKSFIFSIYYLFVIRKKFSIDAIHVANPPDIFFPIGFVVRLLGIKFIFDHHDLSPESYRVKFNGSNGLMYKLLLIMEYLSMKASNLVITTNESLKKKAIQRNGVLSENIIIVRNGPDSNFRSKEKIEKLNHTNHIVSYIGNMGFPDGVENIILAADYICNECNINNISFYLIGYGDQFDSLRLLTKQKKLDNNVIFTNRISDKKAKQILYSSEICLAPDPRNGLNEFHTMNKIAEYMSFGKPIVSFDLDESVFTADESAIYIQDNNYIDFAKAILELIGNPKMREKMGSVGYKRLNEFFTWEHSEKYLQDAYNNLLNIK